MVTHADAGSALVKLTVHGKTDNQTGDYSHVAGTMGGQIRVLPPPEGRGEEETHGHQGEG